ncbi:MAG: hypothetical protein V3V96_04630, partial [Acidiferrobacterales bacterium]
RNAPISKAISSEKVVLLDKNGHPLARNVGSSDSTYLTYRKNAETLFRKVLDDVPVHRYIPEAELERILRANLQKVVNATSGAKTRSPRSYALNVNTGKLTMVYKINSVKFTAEVNAYSIVKYIAAGLTSGSGGYYFATREAN